MYIYIHIHIIENIYVGYDNYRTYYTYVYTHLYGITTHEQKKQQQKRFYYKLGVVKTLIIIIIITTAL